MTRCEESKIGDLILGTRIKYYEENRDSMRRPAEAAADVYHALAERYPYDHPDLQAARLKYQNAQTAWLDWQVENEPKAFRNAAADRRKKLLGKKKNSQAQKSRIEIVDAAGIAVVKAIIEKSKVMEFSDWLYPGALVSLVINEDNKIGLVVEFHPPER